MFWPVDDKTLDREFKQAVTMVSQHLEPFPADILLKLYAYYKIATRDKDGPRGGKPLINAFKTNALFQAKNLTQKQAKARYIETTKNYFIYRNSEGLDQEN
ncbi:MAG: acyl-CoA-binding protein [Flavobacteriaceae bacterium]